MPVDISIRSNIKGITQKLSRLAYQQLPYATAQALNTLAKEVAVAESANIAQTFKRPRPFTVNALGVKKARKDSLFAYVFVKPITAKYLAPYERGGVHKLPGRTLLNPKHVRLDKYGQLPKDTIKRLAQRPDVYVGPIQTKTGIVNGVWQRVPTKRTQAILKGANTRRFIKVKANRGGHLVLLVRFGDALPVTQRLNYRSHAEALVKRRFNAVFGAAMAKAVASAK